MWLLPEGFGAEFLVTLVWLFSPSWPIASWSQELPGHSGLTGGTGNCSQLPMQSGLSVPCLLLPASPPVAIGSSCIEIHSSPWTPEDLQRNALTLLSQYCGWVGITQRIMMYSNDSSLLFYCLSSAFLISAIVWSWWVKQGRKTGFQTLTLQMLLRCLITHSERWRWLPLISYSPAQREIKAVSF